MNVIFIARILTAKQGILSRSEESDISRAQIPPECGFFAKVFSERAVNGKFFALHGDSAWRKADVALKAPSAATEAAHGKKRVVPPSPPDPPEGGPLSRPSLARARPTAFCAPQCGRGGFVGSTAQWPGSSLHLRESSTEVRPPGDRRRVHNPPRPIGRNSQGAWCVWGPCMGTLQ